MPGAAVRVVDGSTITFGTSSWTAPLLSISWSGIDRAAIDTSHIGLSAPSSGTFGNKTYQASDLQDPGSLDLTFHLDPDDMPPTSTAAETVTLTFDVEGSDSTGTTWAGSAFATNFSFDGEMEGVYVGSMTLKFSGAITRTAAT